MAKKRIPAPLERPSISTVLQAALAAVTVSVVLYPFIFHAFGESPFDHPQELIAIAVLALLFMPVIAVIVVVRRLIAPLVSRQ